MSHYDSPTIELVHNEGWEKDGETYARGTAFIDGEMLKSETLVKKVSGTETIQQLQSLLTDANGQYAIIHSSNDGLHIAADHIRSWPIYYSIENGLVISDSSTAAHRISKGDEYNAIAASEYLFTSYVNGSETLSTTVKQIQPGELITFYQKDGELRTEIQRHFCFNTKHGKKSPKIQDIDGIFDRIIKRLIQYADGDPIILPLTGGYDSRLIALKLAEHGYENVVAYTSASSDDSEDLTKAKIIAQDLGFDHVRLQTKRDDYQAFRTSGRWSEFQESVGFLGELPSASSRILLDRLKNHPDIPDTGIRVPGHHALGGASHLPSWVTDRSSISKDEFINFIWIYTYVRWRIDPIDADERTLEKELRDRILSTMPVELYHKTRNESISHAVAGWNTYFWQNRLPKYFLTHYETAGTPYHDWYPLADREYFEFLESLDWKYYIDKNIQKKYVEWLGNEIGNASIFTRGEFESSSGEVFTEGVGSQIKNYLWDRSVPILSKSPKPIEYLIKEVYHRKYVGSDQYKYNQKYSLIPENFFNTVNKRYTHRRSLQLLLLYHYGEFNLSEKNILDKALSDLPDSDIK